MYLLDTNICIYVLKNSYPALTEKVFSYSPSQIAMSSVTIFELEYGAAKSNWGEKTRHRLGLFIAPFTILPFDSDDAVTAGRIRGFLEKQGNIIGPYDYQIAAQGITKGLTVVTHNVREFERIPGIILEDWVI
jgi:tRNA(fMet)-specific endonuclease VapC